MRAAMVYGGDDGQPLLTVAVPVGALAGCKLSDQYNHEYFILVGLYWRRSWFWGCPSVNGRSDSCAIREVLVYCC